ncbi:MAG: hypothetical protein NVSMB43_06450 [Pseudarthrobacter sp.]
MFLELSVLVVVAAMAHLGAVAALAVSARGERLAGPATAVLAGASLGATLAGALLAPGLGPLAWAAAAAVAALCTAYARLQRNLTPSGALVWSTWCSLTAVSAVWALFFLLGLQISALTAWLLWVTVLLAAVTLPSSIVQAREGWEALFRRSWLRPRLALQTLPGAYPRVSIHVPTHAEPPAVVISTLDALAALDYPDFEVLVIDNNTEDPALWEPLREHCLRLGPRFRFLHVEGISGAKAGALNWAAPHTDPDAELIGVVDADYHVSPDWLKRTIGHFAEPRVGFVQAPHAYRDHEGSRFRRWANWEYTVFFTTGMVALNEHNAGLTVGTMSLIRREALVEAGGWAEWCLTEDSELAIRIHALGYDGVYLREPLGWGLIPETFAAYRKQRFRWTYGPVQEMRRHWKLFLPARLGGERTELTWRQRIHHGNHGLDVACIGLRALALPLGALTALSMVVQHENVSMPFALYLASTTVLISSIVLRVLVYTRPVGATLAQALGGTLAFAALNHVIIMASLKALFGHPATWERTNKFPATRRHLGALQDTRTECLIAAAGLAISASLLYVGSGGLITMFALGLGAQSLVYLASPALALIADHELTRANSPVNDQKLLPVGVP